MKSTVAGLALIGVLAGCATRRPATGDPEDCGLVARTLAKAATRLFSTDHLDYDVAVDQAFSQEELLILRGQLGHLVPMMKLALGCQDSVWGATLAGRYGVKELLPLLAVRFFEPRRCYGWEGPDYSDPQSYLTDDQYQYSTAYLAAIQTISGKPIHEAAPPNAWQSDFIVRHARNEQSEFHHWALWMQRKLKTP